MIAKKLTYSKKTKVQKKFSSGGKVVIIKMNALKFHRLEACKQRALQSSKVILFTIKKIKKSAKQIFLNKINITKINSFH